MILKAHSSYPHTGTYVIKLHRDAIPRQGRIHGRLEHVASGHQIHFASGEELLSRLIQVAALAELAAGEKS